jgi:hypothetical protein
MCSRGPVLKWVQRLKLEFSILLSLFTRRRIRLAGRVQKGATPRLSST